MQDEHVLELGFETSALFAKKRMFVLFLLLSIFFEQQEDTMSEID
jgi:hypothetical protein